MLTKRPETSKLNLKKIKILFIISSLIFINLNCNNSNNSKLNTQKYLENNDKEDIQERNNECIIEIIKNKPKKTINFGEDECLEDCPNSCPS